MFRKIAISVMFPALVFSAGSRIYADDSITGTAFKAARTSLATVKYEAQKPEDWQLSIFKTRRFSFNELYDPELSMWTGFDSAPFAGEIAIVYVDLKNAHSFSGRMIFAMDTSTPSAPSVFFSTGPFSGDCGGSVIQLSPRRLIKLNNKLLLEIREEQLQHACIGQRETVRNFDHLFNSSDNFKEVFAFENFFFDGRETRAAVISPGDFYIDTAGVLLLTTSSDNAHNARTSDDSYHILEWTKEGVLVPGKVQSPSTGVE